MPTDKNSPPPSPPQAPDEAAGPPPLPSSEEKATEEPRAPETPPKPPRLPKEPAPEQEIPADTPVEASPEAAEAEPRRPPEELDPNRTAVILDRGEVEPEEPAEKAPKPPPPPTRKPQPTPPRPTPPKPPPPKPPPPKPPPPRPPAAATGTAPGWLKWAGLAVVLAIVGGGAAWWLTSRSEAPASETAGGETAASTESPTESPGAAPGSESASGVPAASAASAEGRVVIDARPWGEVTRILRDDGSELPLPDDRTAPLALSLPAGSYRVELSHPEAAEVQSCEIEVPVGGSATCRVDLLTVDGSDYFQATGWPS